MNRNRWHPPSARRRQSRKTPARTAIRSAHTMRLKAKCVLVAVMALLASGAGAQVFRVQGGTSTLLNAEGGSVEFKAPNYSGTAGLGYYNGKVQFGAETRYQLHGYTILAGD